LDLPPDSKLPNLLFYEELLAANSGDYAWPLLDENSASSLCYASGTTDTPPSRCAVFASFDAAAFLCINPTMPNSMNVSIHDSVMPVVPMFHINVSGLPHAVPLTSTKIVFPGPCLYSKSLCELLEQEQITVSPGSLTVWLGLLKYMSTE